MRLILLAFLRLAQDAELCARRHPRRSCRRASAVGSSFLAGMIIFAADEHEAPPAMCASSDGVGHGGRQRRDHLLCLIILPYRNQRIDAQLEPALIGIALRRRGLCHEQMREQGLQRFIGNACTQIMQQGVGAFTCAVSVPDIRRQRAFARVERPEPVNRGGADGRLADGVHWCAHRNVACRVVGLGRAVIVARMTAPGVGPVSAAGSPARGWWQAGANRATACRHLMAAQGLPYLKNRSLPITFSDGVAGSGHAAGAEEDDATDNRQKDNGKKEQCADSWLHSYGGFGYGCGVGDVSA